MEIDGATPAAAPTAPTTPAVPAGAREVPLRNRAGEVVAHALVSEEHYEEVMRWRWWRNPQGYAASTFSGSGKGKTVTMHRYILELAGVTQPTEDARVIDHKNGNRIDNRRENLSWATWSQNGFNTRRPLGVTGLHGVLRNAKGYYYVRIGKYIKCMKTREAAGMLANRIYSDMGVTQKLNLEFGIADEVPKTKKYASYRRNSIDKRVDFIEESDDVVSITTSKGVKVLMSKEDALELPGTVTMGRYPIVTEKRKTIMLHLWVAKRMGLLAGPEELIDHIDRDKCNSTRANLRVVSRATNAHNRNKTENCSSRFYGVCLCRKSMRWLVYVNKKYGGKFENEEDAARRADQLAIHFFGSNARLNFPQCTK